MRSVTLPDHFRLLIAAGLFTLCAASRSQEPPPAPPVPVEQYFLDRFMLAPRDSVVLLSHEFVVSGSERVFLDSLRLRNRLDYTLESRPGRLTLHRGRIRSGTADTLSRQTLLVRYRALPLAFKPSYSHREIVVKSDSSAGRQVRTTRPPGGFSIDDLFGANLQKSGSIVRGLTVGTNRDLSLNSGFRMQMAGNLSRDLEVVAALTDENSPIQPEGTTRTLQEVDKVFVELRGTDLSATLGDFSLGLAGNEFGGLNRKLQGAKGTASYRTGGTEGELLLAGAVPRGKFTTNQFDGADGVQGPYRLAGQNNERDILVLAGTERVYVNGERMARGETGDYVIDYATGEVTFTPRRFISRISRIVVDFEFTDRQFSRTLVAGKSGASFLDRRLTFGAEVLVENDNQDSPVDVTLGDSDRAVLRDAGNDRNKAVRSGVTFAGPGKGQYVRVDTVVTTGSGADSSIFFYRFAPSDSLNAVYSVAFSYVGAGNGDYAILSLGRFQFAGLRQGSYSPIRFLPMPAAHRLADFGLGAKVTDELTIGAEYALSDYDANRFSPIGDGENRGPAAAFNLRFGSENPRLAGRHLGARDLAMKERYVDRRFDPADRVNEIEFNRKWNIVDSSRLDEVLREGAIVYRPGQAFSLSGGLGWMKRGEPFLSRRITASANLSGEGTPRASYDLELIRSRDGSLDDRGEWFRHKALAEQTTGLFTPGIADNGEVLRSTPLSADTMKHASFRFQEIAPRFRIDSLGRMSLRGEIAWRWEDSISSGALRPASTSLTERVGWGLQEWNSLSTSLDLTLRKKVSLEAFRRPGQSDFQDILIRSHTSAAPFRRGIEADILYELATEQSAKLERVYQQVQKGQGSYVYLGDVNGNHLVDDADFRLARFDGDYISVTVPADELLPVIDLKAGTRLRLNGSRLFAGGDWPGKILAALSSETYARVDEKSSEPDRKQIYLLHFSRFLDDRTTIAGSNLFSQDLYLWENNPEYSLRLRYSQRRGLTKYALADENTFSDERSVRVRWQPVREFSNQTDLIQRKDLLSSPQSDYRVRSILSRSIETDWTYRPEQSVEMGIKVTTGEALNFDTSRASLNTESIRGVYSLAGKGQVRAEFTREEVTLARAGGILPFELTGGKVGGQSWLWHVGMDYRLTQFIQSTISYDGRSEGGSSPVHTMKAEVRAFF